MTTTKSNKLHPYTHRHKVFAIFLYVIKNDGSKVAPTYVHNKHSAPEMSELKRKTLNFPSFVYLGMHKITHTIFVGHGTEMKARAFSFGRHEPG